MSEKTGHGGPVHIGSNSDNSPTVRIGDVARRAGVSPATVSRVLNGAPTVKALHRARVLQAVADLEYRPNLLARNLRRQKAETIGVLVSDIENPHFTEMVRTVEDAAFRLGYRVLLCNTDETAEKQRAYLEVLAAERVSGVVLTPSNPVGAEITALLDLGIPVVAFDRPVHDPRADTVVPNNAAAGRLATQHLLEGGHTRIGFISSPEVETGAERLRAYEDALTAIGAQPVALSGYSRIEGGIAATEQLLRTPGGLTALIAGNNLMALGALKTLRSHGIRIPQDIALVGIDDPFWAELVDPPLTALAQPVRRMASSLVELLLERLHGRTHPRHLVFDFDLRWRASSGRAAPSGPRQPLTGG